MLRTRVLSVTLRTRLLRRSAPRLAGRELDGEAVDGRQPVGHAAVVGAHERARPCARRSPALNWTIATTLRFGCALASCVSALGDGAAWATDALAASESDGGEQDRNGPGASSAP